MDVQRYYSSLPYDLAGSRSKNRFRMELLWGISKILDLMSSDRDFTVVFDYVCDIEVHYKDGLEFYQIKTHRAGSAPYTCKSLTTKTSKNAQGSILGKLFILNKGNGVDVKLVVVSNVPIKIGAKCLEPGEINLASLPQSSREVLENALKNELNVSDIDLTNAFYLHTNINLLNPEYEIQGKIVCRFHEIKHCEPNNPRALYRLIVDTVHSRACYEYSQNEYEEIIEKKGITRDEFNRILDIHAENEKTGIKQAREYIGQLGSVTQKREYNKAIARLIQLLPKSKPLHRLERKISKFLLSTDCGPQEETIDQLRKEFLSQFPIEYDEATRILFFVVIIGRFEQGVYDHENAI